MSHALILALILGITFFLAFFYLLKNKPQYLVLLGIRGLCSVLFIQLIHFLCGLMGLPSILKPNFLSIGTGAFLGIPGILLLYLSSIYLL